MTEKLYRLELNWNEIFALDDLLDLTEELEPEVFRGFDEEAIKRIQVIKECQRKEHVVKEEQLKEDSKHLQIQVIINKI